MTTKVVGRRFFARRGGGVAMFIARWIIDAKFGHKDETLALCRKWQEEVGARVGLPRSASRVLTGSIGAAECRFEFESQVQSLADLEKTWTEMAKVPAHKKFAQELEQHVVSGTNRWEILRVVET
jgi:hypothetical protein